MKNQRKQKETQVLRPCLRTKKSVKHEGDSDTNCNRHTWNDLWRVRKGRASRSWKSEDKWRLSKLQHCWEQLKYLILARWPDLIIINKKKKKRKKEKKKKQNLQNRALSADHWVKLKRTISTLTLLGNWKKLWTVKTTFIPIVIGVLDIVTKWLINKGTGGLGSKRTSWDHPNYSIFLEEYWRLEETCHSNFSERPSANADVKNSQGVVVE